MGFKFLDILNICLILKNRIYFSSLVNDALVGKIIKQDGAVQSQDCMLIDMVTDIKVSFAEQTVTHVHEKDS